MSGLEYFYQKFSGLGYPQKSDEEKSDEEKSEEDKQLY